MSSPPACHNHIPCVHSLLGRSSRATVAESCPAKGSSDQMRFGVAKNVPIARPKKAESSLSRMLKSAGERTLEEMAPDLMPACQA